MSFNSEKTITDCPHVERSAKAKGMCQSCYKKNLKCEKALTKYQISGRPHFAKGKRRNYFHIDEDKERRAKKYEDSGEKNKNSKVFMEVE